MFGVVARCKAPKGYIGLWINVYRHGSSGRYFQIGGAYPNRYEADVVAKSHRYNCVYVCIPID